MPMIDDEQRKLHWRRSAHLMFAGLAAILFLGLLVPRIGPVLNHYFFLRFPFGYFMAAHGAVVGLIAVIYWFNGRQERLDRRHGVDNEF
jgi:putative solute:sodium symporter small subunit